MLFKLKSTKNFSLLLIFTSKIISNDYSLSLVILRREKIASTHFIYIRKTESPTPRIDENVYHFSQIHLMFYN